MDAGSLYREHLLDLTARYRSALEEHELAQLVVHSGAAAAQSRFDDQYWPHKPTPYFAHWAPLREADAWLVLAGSGLRLHRTPHDSYWESPAPDAAEFMWQHLETDESGSDGAASHAKSRTAVIAEDPRAAVQLGFDPDQVNPAAFLASLDRIRAHKTDYERHCIGEANRIAARGHARLAELFSSGVHSELELHLAFLGATSQDATETPYGNIVALGANSAVLHHVHYTRDRSGARSLLVDAGATHLGYASDITRTWSKGNGEVAQVFRRLIERIEAMQRSLCERVRPGLEYEDLHEEAHRQLAVILIDLGIATPEVSVDALVDTGVTRALFPHGLGHSLGLQVHDVGCKPRPPKPNNPYLRTTAVIEDGHVLTIEPGCYFIGSLLEELRQGPHGSSLSWTLVEELRDFGGVRIEDDVAVGAERTLNLTRDNWPEEN